MRVVLFLLLSVLWLFVVLFFVCVPLDRPDRQCVACTLCHHLLKRFFIRRALWRSRRSQKRSSFTSFTQQPNSSSRGAQRKRQWVEHYFPFFPASQSLIFPLLHLPIFGRKRYGTLKKDATIYKMKMELGVGVFF